MGTQNYNTISQPSLGAFANTLGLVVKKDQEKQRKELAHLAVVLKAVEEAISDAKSGVSTEAPKGPTESSGASDSALEDILAKMAGSLQHLQAEIAKYAASKADAESVISQAELTVAQDNLAKANEVLDKLAKEAKTQKTLKVLEKVGECVAALLMTVVAAATAQPELLIPAALCLLGAFGVLSKASEGVALILEAAGVPNDAAKIIGGLLVMAVVLLATAGLGVAAGVETGAAAIADEVLDATEEGVELAADSDSFLTKIEEAFKNINDFRKHSKFTNLMILAAIQSATQTGVITNSAGGIAEAIAEKKDKENAEAIRQKVEMIVGIIVAVASLVVTAGTGSALAEGANIAQDAESGLVQETSILSKIYDGLREFGISATGQRLFLGINAMAALEVATAGITADGYQIDQAKKEEKLAQYRAGTALINTAMSMNTEEMSSSQQFLEQQISQLNKTDSRELSLLMKGEEAYAELLSSSMV